MMALGDSHKVKRLGLGRGMKTLFITRKYPPIVGGMENYSYNLIKYFKKLERDTYFIVNAKGNKYLPLFLPKAYFEALSLIKKNKITHVHICDALMAPLGNRIKRKTAVKTSITVHGLDITYNKGWYQKYIPRYVAKFDNIICISNNTKKECIKRGIPENKISIIPNGVNPDEFYINKPKKELRNKLAKKLTLDLGNKKILFTSGRLVKRKGVEWFVNNVMPNLSNNYIYLVSGDGPEKENIKKAINENNLNDRVFLLGKTDFEILKLLYNTSDLFIMPNISVEGNIEGFGIVAIEAGSCGLSVIASNIEGIKDAVINGKTGWLVKEKDSKGFIKIIKGKNIDRDKVRKEVIKNFDWKTVTEEYRRVLR